MCQLQLIGYSYNQLEQYNQKRIIRYYQDSTDYSEYPVMQHSDKIQSVMLDLISSSLSGKQISVSLEFETLKESEG